MNSEGSVQNAEALPTLPHPDSRARRSARAVRRFAGSLVVATVVLIADQLTKGLAETLLPRFPDGSISIAGDFLRLTYVANRGAAFGILQERTFFFVIVGVAVIAVILASYRYFPVNGALLNLALGLQLGGAVGNLIDRVRYGYVVDFVDVSVWPVFNLADSAIVVGVGILAFRLMQKDRAKADP